MEGQTVSMKEAKRTEERAKSTIKFPYGDLDDAISVADAIWRKAGEECSRSQLAAFLDQTPTSGAYRLKVATASNFGLVKSTQGKVRLTPLGKDIVDPQRSRAAKVRAFYHVPLYKKLHERFDGYSLPPPAALERVMVEMGVSQKQADTARQVFHRSAQQAGFFEHGTSRLVEPVSRSGEAETDTSEREDTDRGEPLGERGGRGGGAGGGGGGSDLNPFIQGLLGKLPKSESEQWSSEDQLKWLQTAATIFNLVYGGTGEIEVRMKSKGNSERQEE